MMYDLPKSVSVCGTEYAIETDYRTILDIFQIINAPELSAEEKNIGILGVFYPDFCTMPVEHFEEALKQFSIFANCGNAIPEKKSPKLMDWEQDFPLLIAPINRIAGKEVRAVEYLHWWTFISMYQEIGDCYFAHVVRIRDLKKRGKLSDKSDKEFYRKNRDVIDIKRKYSEEDQNIINEWI